MLNEYLLKIVNVRMSSDFLFLISDFYCLNDHIHESSGLTQCTLTVNVSLCVHSIVGYLYLMDNGMING